jgi:hypothetical protein
LDTENNEGGEKTAKWWLSLVFFGVICLVGGLEKYNTRG